MENRTQTNNNHCTSPWEQQLVLTILLKIELHSSFMMLRQRRYDRVIGVTNEMVMCLYISIGDTSLNFLSTTPQPISHKRWMFVLLLLLSFI